MTADTDGEWRYLWLPFLCLFAGLWVFLASGGGTTGGGQLDLLTPLLGKLVAGAIVTVGFIPTLAKLVGDMR